MAHHILIDYENVQPSSLKELDPNTTQVHVFLGCQQKKDGKKIVAMLQQFAGEKKVTQAFGQGHNALDFHIAYHIGRLVSHDTRARIYILSKDTGFDPLIRHLQANQIGAKRCETITQCKTKAKAQPARVATPGKPKQVADKL